MGIMCLWVWFSGFEKSVPMCFLFLLIKLPTCFCEEEKKEKEWRRRRKKNGRWSESVKKKERKKKKKEEEKSHWVSLWRRKERKSKEEKKNKSKDMTSLWPCVLEMYVYLPKCYHNSVFITQKHLKVVFSFANSSLKN